MVCLGNEGSAGGYDSAQSMGGCDGAQSAGERSYTMPEDRGRSREDPMAEGRQPRGAAPHPRPGATVGSSNPSPRSGGCAGA